MLWLFIRIALLQLMILVEKLPFFYCLITNPWFPPFFLLCKVQIWGNYCNGDVSVMVHAKWWCALIEVFQNKVIWAATWENRIFAYAKTKTQISFAVTAKLINVFVFATRIVQSLSFLNAKFQASSRFMRLRSLIFVGPGRKSRRPVFWRRGSYAKIQ